MKKNIGYLIIIFLMIFCGMNRVEAASEMACKYRFVDDKFDIYLYQNPSSSIKPKVFKMYQDGKNFYVYDKVPSIKSIVTDSNGYLTGCPNNASTNFWGKLEFSGDDNSNRLVSSNYSEWDCKYEFSDSKKYVLNIKQNKFGLINFDLQKDGKSVDDKQLVFYGFTYGQNSCPQYVASKAFLNDPNGKKISFYNKSDLTSTNGYTECTGSGCPCSGSNCLSVPSGSGSSEDKQCSSNGNNCEYSDILKNAKICIYENAGYCSTRCLGDYCQPSSLECSPMATPDVNSRFKTSPYMLFTYNNYGKIDNVFLPKSSSRTGDILKRINDYRNNGASSAYMADLFDHYNTLYDAENRNEVISAIQSWNTCENQDDKCYVSSCLDWFNGTSGYNGNEYETETYAWKRIDLTLDDLEKDNSEDPGGAVSEGEFEATKCDYFCEYNNGNLVLKFSSKKNKINLMVYSPTEVISSANWSYSYGTGIADITWKSAAGAYGGTVGANNGNFENLMLNGTCPAKLMYNPYDKELFICDKESDCEDDEHFYSAVNPSLQKCSYDSTEVYEDCKTLIGDDLINELNKYFLFFRIVVPILVIVLGVVDFAKAIFASKEENMKKAQSDFMKRILIAVIIFLIPTLVNLLMKIANIVWGWNSDTCGIGISTIMNWW